MKFASDSKDKQKDLFFKRKVAIHNTRAEKLKNSIEEKKRKELALSAEKEKLSHQLEVGVYGLMRQLPLSNLLCANQRKRKGQP